MVSSASPGVKPLITFRYHRWHKSIVLKVSKIKLIISTKSDLPLVCVPDHNDYIQSYAPPFPLTSIRSCQFPTVPNVFVIPHKGHVRSLLSFVSSLECLVHSISRNIFYLFFIGVLLLYDVFLPYSKVDQSHVYIHPLFFGFPSHLGHHRTLSRVPCVIQ